jgi:outer membrane usher protein
MSCRWHHRGVAALLLLVAGFSAQAQDSLDTLIVDLLVNHQSANETFVLRSDANEFYVEESVLRDWQIQRPWPQPERFLGKKFYGLHEFEGTDIQFDKRVMKLEVYFPAALMPSRTVDMSRSGLRARSEEFGAYMDYEFNWLGEGGGGHQTTFGQFFPVVFGGFGNISANTVYRNYGSGNINSDSYSRSGLTVLELTYARDNPEQMRSVRVGDIITSPGMHGRALRVGGVQVGTNFSTRPELVTHPLPDFYGETAIPTAVELYVNGRLTQRQEVQPGSYVLEDVPVVNRFGQMQVVATDVLGRQQVFSQDFFVVPELLRTGLSEYSFSAGALREKFAIENFQYGDFVTTATWRYGLRDNLTVAGHGEISNQYAMLGGNGHYASANGGIFNAGLGFSNSDMGAGARWQLGYRKLSGLFNFSVAVSGTTDKLDVLGSIVRPAKFQLVSTVGKNFYENGSLGLSLVHQDFHSRPSLSIASASYSISLQRFLTISAHLSYVRSDRDDLSAGIRFSMPFGEHHSTSGGFTAGPNDQRIDAEINRALPVGNGFGYHIAAGALDGKFVDAGVIAQNEIGTYRLDVRDAEAYGSTWQIGTSGSVAYLSGLTKLTRQVNDAFAVVNVGDIEGVRVYAENQEIGRTNRNGQIFVPGLRPYLRNQLRIEIEDLPLNAKVGSVSTDTAPYFRSGVVVNFDVSVSNNVVFRAIQSDGTPVPEGAAVRIGNSMEAFPVGLNGKVFLQGIDRSSEITIRWNNRACDIEVPPLTGNAIIEKFGDLKCDPKPAP